MKCSDISTGVIIEPFVLCCHFGLRRHFSPCSDIPLNDNFHLGCNKTKSEKRTAMDYSADFCNVLAFLINFDLRLAALFL